MTFRPSLDASGWKRDFLIKKGTLVGLLNFRVAKSRFDGKPGCDRCSFESFTKSLFTSLDSITKLFFSPRCGSNCFPFTKFETFGLFQHALVMFALSGWWTRRISNRNHREQSQLTLQYPPGGIYEGFVWKLCDWESCSTILTSKSVIELVD